MVASNNFHLSFYMTSFISICSTLRTADATSWQFHVASSHGVQSSFPHLHKEPQKSTPISWTYGMDYAVDTEDRHVSVTGEAAPHFAGIYHDNGLFVYRCWSQPAGAQG